LLSQWTHGQGLQIGDKLPNIELSNVINHNTDTINLYATKSKLIILDFWATNCFSCINAFPKLDSLQKKYAGQIQIIAINKESKDSTLKFFSRFKKIKMPAIPFVMGDTVLSKLFPHKLVPHHVWIDSSKTVKFITYGWNANESAIGQYLSGKNPNLAEIIYRENVTIENPLVKEISDRTVYHSLLTHYIHGASIGNKLISTVDDFSHPNRITRNSSSILSLFLDAYSERGKFNFQARNTVMLKGIELKEIDYPTADSLKDKWLNENSYNYDLLIPPSESTNLYKLMQQDLSRYFNIEAKIATGEVLCWVIIRTSKTDKLKSKGKESKYFHNGIPRDSLWYYHDKSMSAIASRMQASLALKGTSITIIDGTKYKGNVDMALRSFKNNFISLSDIKTDLEKYDLDIVVMKKKIPVLLLEKKTKSSD
jgi:thiol-disulfide isomerase/thioredoxin